MNTTSAKSVLGLRACRVALPVFLMGIPQEPRILDGLFHQWATVLHHRQPDNTFFFHTVALVEIEEGEIAEVLPRNLRFLNKPELPV